MVSCVIPVYRAVKTLSACLDSLLASVDIDFELLAILNGEDDGSAGIAETYSRLDKRVRVLRSATGPSAARNAGIDQARGEYICFCDSDDTVEPDWMARMSALMDCHGADMAVCGYSKLTCDSEGNILRREYFHHLREGAISAREYLLELDTPCGDGFGNVASMCFRMVRAKLLRERGIRLNESYFFAEDFDFIIRLLPYCERVALTHASLYHYYRRDQGTLVSAYHANVLDAYADIIRNALAILTPPRTEGEQRIAMHTLASLSIGGMVRLCRRNATISDDEIKDRLRSFLGYGFLPELYAAYHPKPGQSKDIPELALSDDIDALFLCCRGKSKEKFGV